MDTYGRTSSKCPSRTVSFKKNGSIILGMVILGGYSLFVGNKVGTECCANARVNYGRSGEWRPYLQPAKRPSTGCLCGARGKGRLDQRLLPGELFRHFFPA